MRRSLPMAGLLLAVFLFAAYLFASLVVQKEQIGVAKEAAVYNRTITCILSVPLATRTYEYISSCYDEAEKAHGIKVERFTNKDYK